MHERAIIFMVLEVGGRGPLGSESKELHETVIISCLWKWVGGGRVAPESQEMHGTLSIFMVLEVGGKLAAGIRIIRNAWDCYHFQSFRSATKTWNNYLCIGLLSFS